jgi:TIR domain
MSVQPSAPLIFVSHKASDADVARELQRALDTEFLGHPRFFNSSDHESVQPGIAWFDSIVDALRECAVLLVILSPAALASAWVNFEAGAAWIKGALVIPCCIGQVRKSSLPAPYGHLQGVDLDDPDDLDQLFKRLASQAGLRCTPNGRTALAKRLMELWRDSTIAEPQRLPAEPGSRIDEHLHVEWAFRESRTSDECWAATYTTGSVIRVIAEQLDSIAITLSPEVEAVTFTGVNTPTAILRECTRASPGQARLAPAHASSGRFAVRIHFDPPLQQGERAAYKVQIDFPAYKLSVRERLVRELLDVAAKMRDYDYSSRKITRSCERFTYQISIPKRLKAMPLRPEALRDGQLFEEEQKYIAREPNVFDLREEDIDGEPYWIAELDRFNPPYGTTYRMQWRLPLRRELEARERQGE